MEGWILWDERTGKAKWKREEKKVVRLFGEGCTSLFLAWLDSFF
jgi:hypothetical protein